jgi:sensor histidine kinase YesM
VQPFIENAIWHGIVPKEQNGSLRISVYGDDDQVICEVDDDGIGRHLSKTNKTANAPLHESKGVRLSEARLSLEKMLNEKENSIRIIDKFDGEVATGTKVIIQFNLQ